MIIKSLLNPNEDITLLESEKTEVIEASIDVESLPFIFDMFIRGIYSKPYNSIVRELVSNATDANVESGVDDVVLIKIERLTSGTYKMSFIDKGIGMNHVDFISYMNFFKSNKRHSNKSIGGFGIGGKSPLALFDYYNFISVKDGVKREYLIYKGVNKPEANLISETQTDEKNGTIVSFEMDYSNIYRFEQAMLNELVYFDNVYVDSINYFNNNFEVLEYDTFKLNTKYCNINHVDLSICIGKVKYPISFEKINRKPVKLPFGLKFEIGELEVTPNREELIYSEKVISLIQSKYDAFFKELEFLLEKQTSNEISDLFDYIALCTKSESTVLTLEGSYSYEVNISNTFLKKNYYCFPSYRRLIPCNLINSLLKPSIKITNGVRNKTKINHISFSDFSKAYLAIKESDINPNTNRHIGKGVVLIFENPRVNAKKIAKNCADDISDYRNKISSKKGDMFDSYSFYKKLSMSKPAEVGWSIRLYYTIREFRKYLYQKCKPYEVDLPKIKVERSSRKLPVSFDNIKGNIKGTDYTTTKVSIPISELQEKKVVFYCNKDDAQVHYLRLQSHGLFLRKLHEIFINNDYLFDKIFKKDYVFIRVDKGSSDDFMKYVKNKVHISKFYKVKPISKMLVKLYISRKYSIKYRALMSKIHPQKLKNVSLYYYEMFCKLKSFIEFCEKLPYGFATQGFDSDYVPRKVHQKIYTEYDIYAKELENFVNNTQNLNYVHYDAPVSVLSKLINYKHSNWYKDEISTTKSNRSECDSDCGQ